MNSAKTSSKLNLRAGEWVEVRSREEILATLDESARLENLPFMPEMLEYAGRRLRVVSRADKTCDPANLPWSIRRLTDSVHLESVRCSGAAHGDCQAGCLIFWKEAWLKRSGHVVPVAALTGNTTDQDGTPHECGETQVFTSTQSIDQSGEVVYSCQATDVSKFTTYMRAWDPRQYIRDLRSGNLSSGLAKDCTRGRILEVLLALFRLAKALTISVIAGFGYPHIAGTCERTPTEHLDLQPGELVEVRSQEEIVRTLNKQNRNRGLLFDTEMVPYCGGIYRVLRRVHHIIDERSGKMINMKFPCIVLEGVVCKSDFHRLCPRAIQSYWRENWLRRAAIPQPEATQGCYDAALCGEEIR